MKIFIDDDDILVCMKPAGILSQSTEGKGTSVQDLYGNVKLYPVHRLDRETTGIMVYAKNQAAASALSEQITQNKFEKKYFAVIKGVPEEKSGELNDLLFRDMKKNKTYLVKRERKGVRKASLLYEVIDVSEGMSLVDVRLITGRTHQIRAQFSGRGMPLCGDGKYGGGPGELALISYSLCFFHPASGKRMEFRELPDIDQYPWNLFGKEKYSFNI